MTNTTSHANRPHTAYALVRNFHSNTPELRFDNFCLWKTGGIEFDKAQRLFACESVDYSDWVYERSYDAIPDFNLVDAPFGRVPCDVEDTLLLLRLHKPGDIVFSKAVIQEQNGNIHTQLPYRVMSNFVSSNQYIFDQYECSKWNLFATELVARESWQSSWFKIARRFFLYGGAKEFKVGIDQVDRIVDYMIAMEACLVPERDFVGRRLKERAIHLLSEPKDDDTVDSIQTKHLLADFYDVRSTIAHGSPLQDKHRKTLAYIEDFEIVIRRVLIAALRILPLDESSRKEKLSGFFDVTDSDRANKVFQDFVAMRDEEERSKLIRRIAKRAK